MCIMLHLLKQGKYTPFLCPNFPLLRMARTDFKTIGPFFFSSLLMLCLLQISPKHYFYSFKIFSQF